MRTITKIIIHCTATPQGRNHTLADVDGWHKERGFKSIGYHYLIDTAGKVLTGRPESEIGAHCLNHNANSIGICYVGGMTADMRQAKDTRTPEQKEALKTLVADLQERYPSVTVHGHCEFAAKDCPSFNVKTEF